MTGLSNKLHAKAAAEKQQSITLVNQSFDERKIVVLRSGASDKTAKQNDDDHFRLAPTIRPESQQPQIDKTQEVTIGRGRKAVNQVCLKDFGVCAFRRQARPLVARRVPLPLSQSGPRSPTR